MQIPTSAEIVKRTKCVSNNKNPEWNEEPFVFHIDPEENNVLGLLINHLLALTFYHTIITYNNILIKEKIKKNSPNNPVLEFKCAASDVMRNVFFFLPHPSVEKSFNSFDPYQENTCRAIFLVLL